jgi:NitT/TauT family transport system substrate-binding protein
MRDKGRLLRLLAILAALVVFAAACGDDDSTTTDEPADEPAGEPADEPAEEPADEPAAMTEISVQLQWVPQAQFAGYFAARDLGFYEEAGLDVTLFDGAVDIVPAVALDTGGADFAVSWVPRAMAPREQGADVVNIAQVFQRSGTLQVAFADSGISTVADLADKTVGNWGFGNEAELLAGLRANGLDPTADVTLVQQSFDMLALLSGDIDAAQAMTYNEYAQVLETVNPDTGELYQPEDLNVIDWNDVGTAMLQDAIWAKGSRLDDDAAYMDAAVRFVEASLRGWIHCRDNQQECVDIVVGAEPPFGGPAHQAWQMNEINALIWPSPNGIGMMDQALWDQSVEIMLSDNVILTAEPEPGAYRTDIVETALANLEAAGLDVNGEGWSKIEVEVTEGGN